MSTPLTDWGYKRKKYTRTATYDIESGQYVWGSWSSSSVTGGEQPSSMNVAGNSASNSSIRQTIYVDYPYLIFPLPSPRTNKTITIKFSSSNSSSREVALRRITSAISGQGVPATTTTHQVTKTISGSGGTYTFDVSTLLDDMNSSGNYGLLLVGTSSATTSYGKSFLISGVSFNWQPATATVPTYPSGTHYIGSSMNITLNNANSSVKNTLRYKFGSQTGTIASNKGNETVSWTPPASLSAQIPSSTSATCTIYCDSTLDGSPVGTSTTTITLTVPSTVKCTVSTVTLTETVASVASQFGKFVQGKSKIKVTATTSSANAQGASVVSCSCYINGATMNIANLSTGATTSALRYYGSDCTYSLTITDSRGRTDTKSGTYTVAKYNAPTVKITSAERVSGTPTSVKVNYTWAIQNISVSSPYTPNSKQITIKWNGTTKTTITPSSYSGSSSYTITGTTASQSGTVSVSAADSFSSTPFTYAVPADNNFDIDVGPDGSIGFGMEAKEQGNLDCNLEIIPHKGIYGLSQKNILDNSWFLINQRGVSSGTTAYNTISIDRWAWDYVGDAGTYSLGSSGLELTPLPGGSAIMLQAIENVSMLDGKRLTASVMLSDGNIYSGTITRVNGTLQNFFNTGNVNVYMNSTGRFGVLVNAVKTIRAVKLEIGESSTLKYDPMPNTADELARCQRFFVPVISTDYTSPVAYGIGYNTTSLRVTFPIGIRMRDNPSIKWLVGSVANMAFYKYDGASTISGSYLSSPTCYLNGNSVLMSIPVSSSAGLITNATYCLRAASSSLKFAFSAELI